MVQSRPMARTKTKKPSSEKNTPVFARVTPSMLARIDMILERHREDDPMTNRSDVVRVLLRKGLEAEDAGR